MSAPLVIINVSDHYTRQKVQQEDASGQPLVIGALLGIQKGRSVEIFNSFELVSTVVDGSIVVDTDYFRAKREQFSTVFKDYDVLGWYSTGSAATTNDVMLLKQFMEFNENPIFLLLDVAAAQTARELPITIYESELHIINDEPTLLFAKTAYRIETEESERIAVDHVAHVSNANHQGTQLTSHLMGVHNAIKMLHLRVEIICQVVTAMQKREIPMDHVLCRKVASLCQSLPAIDGKTFSDEHMNEYNDTLLLTYLSSLTKATNIANELVDKFNVTFDSARSRRGMYL